MYTLSQSLTEQVHKAFSEDKENLNNTLATNNIIGYQTKLLQKTHSFKVNVEHLEK